MAPFECGGDLLWLRDRRLVLAGTGDRTAREAWRAVAEISDAPVVGLELADPEF